MLKPGSRPGAYPAGTFAQVQKRRKDDLREVRALLRSTDTALEKLERRIQKAIQKKRLVDLNTFNTLVPLYNDMFSKMQETGKAIGDYIWMIMANAE